MKKESGKSLFRITATAHGTSQYLVRQAVTVKKGVRQPGFILIRPFDHPVVPLTRQVHPAARPPPLIDFTWKSNPNLALRAQSSQMGQQRFVDLSCPRLQNIVGVNNKAG